MFETFIWNVLLVQNIEDLKPGNRAWKAIMRVRFLHCNVRNRYSCKQQTTNNDSAAKDKVPINQCHLMATLLGSFFIGNTPRLRIFLSVSGFQLNVLYALVMVMDIPLSEQDMNDYTALWKYIGWVIGVDYNLGDPLKDLDTSKKWMQSVWLTLIKPDHTSVELANHVLQSMAEGEKNIVSEVVGMDYHSRAQVCVLFCAA